jgi:DNA-binding XRE family transcriptional regulator
MTRLRRWYLKEKQEDDGFKTVTYIRELSDHKISDEARAERNERRREHSAMEAEISQDPVAAYLHEKQKEDMCTVRRLSKKPEFGTYTQKQILEYVKRTSSNDGMPIVVRRAKAGEDEISPHKLLKDIKKSYRISRAERRIEKNAEEGKFEEHRQFDPEFISDVTAARNYRGMTQRDLALLVNVSENEIKAFEAGKLMYNGALRATLLWKLGMQ